MYDLSVLYECRHRWVWRAPTDLFRKESPVQVCFDIKPALIDYEKFYSNHVGTESTRSSANVVWNFFLVKTDNFLIFDELNSNWGLGCSVRVCSVRVSTKMSLTSTYQTIHKSKPRTSMMSHRCDIKPALIDALIIIHILLVYEQFFCHHVNTKSTRFSKFENC